MTAITDRAANKEKLEAALARVAAIDLDRIQAKLRNKRGWNEKRAAHAVELYRRFLALLVLDRSLLLAPPSEDADAVWHAHILDTRAYHHDCETLFGVYLHHVPSYGTHEDQVLMAICRERTELAFQTHFGTPADEATAAGCVPCYGEPINHQAEEKADVLFTAANRVNGAAGCVPCLGQPASHQAAENGTFPAWIAAPCGEKAEPVHTS
jgi:hypothetical protein